MRQKRVFESLFLFLVFSLIILPFLLTFNDVLTKIVQKFFLYNLLQDYIVPYEVQLVGLLVKPFGVNFTPFLDGMKVNDLNLRMQWNCLGWQSLVIFLGSLIVGLRGGSYTLASKLSTIIIGLFGVFWINLFRITFTVLLAVYSQPLFKIVFHDYLAAIVTIIFLFFFWWFSYSYVLEEKTPDLSGDHSSQPNG